MPKTEHKLMKMAIGNILRKNREDMNLNQEQLSRLVYGKSAQLTVSKSELGNRNLPCHEMLKYIRVFKIKPDSFFASIQKEFSRLSKK
jgi:transcriptional regulator with XRE-family HTH domain